MIIERKEKRRCLIYLAVILGYNAYLRGVNLSISALVTEQSVFLSGIILLQLLSSQVFIRINFFNEHLHCKLRL